MSAARGTLRILHVVHSQRFAGVEQFVQRLAVAQARGGDDVAVIGGSASLMRQPLAEAGVRYIPTSTFLSTTRAVAREATGRDVVNTHMTAADAAAAVALAPRGLRPAVTSTRHFAQPRGRRLPPALTRFVSRRIDAEISISRTVAAAIDVPSTVVFPGVDPRPAPESASRRPVVLMAQRLQPEKHTSIGIRAFALSGLADEGWVLEVAGAGPDEPALRAIADELGVSGAVRFLGFRLDLPERMSTSGLLLATSPLEHFGLTVLEAMSNALPVVASAAGGHVEMLYGLDPRTFYAPSDVEAAAAAIGSLARDAAGRARLGAAERDRQQRSFSLDAQVAGTDAVYRAVVHRKAAAR